MALLRPVLILLLLLWPQAGSAQQVAVPPPPSPAAVKLLSAAEEQLKSDKPQEALVTLAGYQYDAETLVKYHVLSAKALRKLGRNLDALPHQRSAYIFSPDSLIKEQMLLERADTYYDLRYFSEAELVYRIFIKAFPHSLYTERVNISLAQCLAETGQLHAALDHFRKAGEHPLAVLGMAGVMQKLGMQKEAGDAFKKALARTGILTQASPELRYLYAEHLRQGGNLAEAGELMKDLKDPVVSARAAISMGLIALAQSSYDKALQLFQSAAKSPERTVRRKALLQLAGIYEQTGKPALARQMLEEITRNYPYGDDYDEAALRLANALRREKKDGEAVRLLKGLVYRARPSAAALDEFEAMLRDARTKAPSEVATLWNEAGAFLLDKSREKFLLETAEVLSGNPEAYTRVLQYLARYGSEQVKTSSTAMLASYALDKGNLAAAREHLRSLKLMKGSSDDVLRVEARIAMQAKDFREASRRLLPLRRYTAADLAMMGRLIKTGSALPELFSHYERGVKALADPGTLALQHADILYDRGRQKESLDYYRRALKDDPANDWVLYRIGLLAEGDESKDALSKTGKESPQLAGMARAIEKEREVAGKLAEQF